MHLVLLGAPGTGKGTQAKALMDRFGWAHISTGEMLREAVASDNELGRAAKSYMEQGSLVPDELVIEMLIDRISHPDAARGFILDGFPRNRAQAVALDEDLAAHGAAIDVAVNLAVPREELVRRLTARRTCPRCGAIYNLVNHPPADDSKCDKCGAQLIQRDDDKPETVTARLDRQWTPAELLAYYRMQRKLVELDGLLPAVEVTRELIDKVTSRVGSK